MSAQLQQAIINAHNAGDIAAAQRLGQLLKQQKQAVPQQTTSPSSVPPHRRNQPKERDGAFAFSVDQAQKMYGGAAELAGRALGIPTIEQYGRNVQAQQDKDIAEGGYQSKYSTFEDSYKKGGLASALGWAAEGVAENAATTGASLLGALGVSAAAVYGAPAWLVAAAGGTTALNNVALNTGENVLEQKEKLGDFDTAYATGAGLLAGALDTVGAGRAIPKDALKTMTVDQIKETLEKQGKGVAAKEFMKRMGVESVTESAQEGISIGTTASLGGEYTPEDVRTRLTDSFLLGGATAGSVNVGIGSAKGAANLVRGNSKNIKDEGDVQAAASFAQRLTTIANANEYDLQDIDKMSTKGARETIDKAHVQYTEELKQKFADLKSRVKITDQDTLAEVADKIMTAAAYREGRNKTKNTVGNQEMAALERLTGDTREGQEAMSILRQLNQLTQVHNDGYQGGVSQVTDQFAPFGASVGYDKGAVATERLLRPLASGSAAITTGGSSLLAQAAAQGTGRLIDKVTGKRSKVANYIKDNQGRQGIPTSDAPSLREQKIAEEKAAQEAEIKAAEAINATRQRQAAEGFPVPGNTPLGTAELILDTDVDQIVSMAAQLAESHPDPLIRQSAQELIASRSSNLESVTGLNQVIAEMKRMINPDNTFWRQREAQLKGVGQQAAQQQLSQKDQNYQRGIENNRAEAARITEAVNADSTIPVQQKAMLLNTLEEMQLDLGLNPVSRLQSMARRLEEQDVPGPTVEKYLGQYLQRVMAQQGAKAERDAAQDDAMEIDESREISFTNSANRVSPAMPTGVKPLFDSNVEKTPVSLALINQDPTLPKRIVDKMRPYVPFRDAPSDDQSFLEQAVDFMKNNLVALYESVSPEYRDRAKLWYVGANKLSQGAADTYGQTLEAVAGVMSALSPGLDWYVNYDIGVRLLDIYTNHQDTVFGDAESAAAMQFVNNIKAKTPRQVKNKDKHKAAVESITGKTLSELDAYQQAYFVRFYDVANATERGHRIVTPEGELGDFVLNKNGSKKASVFSDFPPIATAMAILADPSPENISALMGIGHKRRNFYNNILDPMSDQGDVTIDTHAVGAALFLPLSQASVEVVNNFGTPDSKNIGSYGTYGVYAEAYRRAAEEVGVLPREMQSITWEAARGLFPATWKAQKKNVDSIRAIWEDYKNGKLSLEKARQTVYETAGNIRSAQWEDDRPSFGIYAKNVVRDDSGSIPRSGVSRGDQLRSGIASTGGVLQSSQEVDLSTQPALTQPESPQIPFDFTTPTVKEVKDKLLDAKSAVQMSIGKPGGKYENGLRNIFDVFKLADILDVSVGIFKTQEEFMEKYPVNAGTKGLFAIGKGGVTGKIGIVEQDQEVDSLLTGIHEVAHPLEARPPTNKPGEIVYGQKVKGVHPLVDDQLSTIYRGSLRHKIRVETEMDTDIAKEIEELQNAGTIIRLGARPDLPGQPIRLTLDGSIEKYQQMYKNAPPSESFIAAMTQYPAYQSYIKRDAERAVDPLFFYLVNPKAMKASMPKTFKLIQTHFNESSIPIKLYTQPLATIVAIVMAGVMSAEKGEEEENPGILTPGPGMLSA